MPSVEKTVPTEAAVAVPEVPLKQKRVARPDKSSHEKVYKYIFIYTF